MGVTAWNCGARNDTARPLSSRNTTLPVDGTRMLDGAEEPIGKYGIGCCGWRNGDGTSPLRTNVLNREEVTLNASGAPENESPYMLGLKVAALRAPASGVRASGSIAGAAGGGGVGGTDGSLALGGGRVGSTGK